MNFVWKYEVSKVAKPNHRNANPELVSSILSVLSRSETGIYAVFGLNRFGFTPMHEIEDGGRMGYRVRFGTDQPSQQLSVTTRSLSPEGVYSVNRVVMSALKFLDDRSIDLDNPYVNLPVEGTPYLLEKVVHKSTIDSGIANSELPDFVQSTALGILAVTGKDSFIHL